MERGRGSTFFPHLNLYILTQTVTGVTDTQFLSPNCHSDKDLTWVSNPQGLTKYIALVKDRSRDDVTITLVK